MNYARTALLLAAMTGLFLAVGYLIGGQGGMTIAFVIALAMNGFAYWNSDKLVLRMHGAQEISAHSAPELHAIVGRLAERQRTIFVMRHYNQMKNEEIAAVLKISLGTVKSLHFKALQNLRGLMAPYLGVRT